MTKLTKRKVNKKSFAPPAGYKIEEMPVPPGGMGSMPTKMPTTQEEAEKMRDEWMKKMKNMQR